MPKRNGEGAFEFLNRVDDSAFAQVRLLTDDWIRGYACDVGDLLGRMRSSRDTNFYGAFWELYIHETFRRLGCRMAVHPSTPSGAEIDFRAHRGEAEVFVEATTHPLDGLDGDRLPKGSASVLDKIEKAENLDFTLGVQIDEGGRSVPPTRRLVAPIERWLNELDWASGRHRMEQSGLDVDRRSFDVDGWSLKCTAYPRTGADRGDTSIRLISVYPAIGGFTSSRGSILRKLRAKAYKYGTLDAPFIVALDTPGVFTDQEDVIEALYGPQVVDLGDDTLQVAGVSRESDGLWQHRSHHSAGRVSGVLVSLGLSPFGLAKRWPTLWLNPWADFPLDPAEWPWPYVTLNRESDQLEVVEAGSRPWEFFGLVEGWPGVPFQAAKQRRALRRQQHEQAVG